MMSPMRTTIRIDDELLRRVKERAATSGRTIGSIIEDALRVALAAPAAEVAPVRPLPVYGGSGVLPGVDLSSAAALRDLMDDGVSIDALR